MRIAAVSLVCAGVFFALEAWAQDAGASATTSTQAPGVTVEVTVENLVGAQGSLLMSLHTTKDTFPSKSSAAFRHEWVKVTQTPVRYRFEHVQPGTYAVGAAHDENGNGKIDTGIFGIPIEGIGVSNNPFSLGPPSFNSAKFDVGAQDVVLTIRLKR